MEKISNRKQMATATRSNGDIGGMCKAPVRFQQLFFNQSSQNEGEVENVRVVVRLRPLSESEIKAGFRQIVRVDSVSNTISVENPNGANGEPPKSFTYDMVFNTEISQLDVYNEIARPIVNKVLMGYNGTILAYGQTGTGKTYTMEGICSSPELKGIIPNSFAHIFGHIAKATENTKFLVRVSHIEIYNEEIRDLLNKDQSVRLEVKERPDIGVYVPDISGYVVNNAVDMERIMKMGNKNRAIGATAMNASSSRSHAIFTITIENSTIGEDGKEHIKMGKLHLVDLAGSERQCKTGASGVRLKEATKINLSLSTLGNVISALVDGKSTHIPYRNSKLTRLLQDSLGGNSKTVMCANIGPADYNYDETISTLRYASRAKHVQNRAKVNEDPKDALLRQFQLEIEELRKQLEDVGQPSNDIESDSDSGDSKVTNGEISKLQKSRLPSNNSENADNVSETSSITEEQVKKENECEEKHDADFKDSQNEHKELLEKLKNLEKKILVGGENLLEKAELQEQLLEASQRELEQRKKKEEELREALEAKEAELIDIEERYSSLQEEAAGKTKKLKKVVGMFLAAKAELSDLQQEQQREMEGLLDSIRSLTRELKLQETIINSFIPKQYQEMLDQYVHWNEDIGEWQLKCVAYTGNNMRKQMADHSSGQNKEYQAPDLSHVYLSYNSDKVTNPVRPRLRSGIAETARQRYPTNYRTKSCI